MNTKFAFMKPCTTDHCQVNSVSTSSLCLLWRHFLMSSMMTCKSLCFVFILEFKENKTSKISCFSRISLSFPEGITDLLNLEGFAVQDGKKKLHV